MTQGLKVVFSTFRRAGAILTFLSNCNFAREEENNLHCRISSFQTF